MTDLKTLSEAQLRTMLEEATKYMSDPENYSRRFDSTGLQYRESIKLAAAIQTELCARAPRCEGKTTQERIDEAREACK